MLTNVSPGTAAAASFAASQVSLLALPQLAYLSRYSLDLAQARQYARELRQERHVNGMFRLHRDDGGVADSDGFGDREALRCQCA
jgi:hypothetical protein